MGAVLGAYAGVFGWIAFIAGWIAMFGPTFAKAIDEKQRPGRLVISTAVLMAAVIGIVAYMPHWFFMESCVDEIPLLVLIAVAGCAVIVVLKESLRALAMVIAAGLSSLVAAPTLIEFGRIAHTMWDWRVDAGSVRSGNVLNLAVIHVLFIVACIVLTLVLWVRGWKGAARPSAPASFVFVVCLSMAFFWTVPRGGDEGTFMWVFIIPAFALPAFVLLLTSVVGLIRVAGGLDYSFGRWGPYEPYGDQR